MDKKKLKISLSEKRQAADTFSITPIQDTIDARFDEDVRDTFSAKELKHLHSLAKQALGRVHKNDVYGAEVFLQVPDDRAAIYDMEVEPPRRVAISNATLYGLVQGFIIDKLPDGGDKLALSVAFENYSKDMTELGHSYLVPLAIEGANYGVRLIDAPTPIGDSDVEVLTQDMPDIDKQDIEQDIIHSLLDIVETDLFDEEILDTKVLEESLEAFQEVGYIKQIEDMTTAINYYLQKCLHDEDPWLIEPNGVMERVSHDPETGKQRITTQYMSGEELTVVGIDIVCDDYRGVWCRIFARSDDGVLYQRPLDNEGYGLTLYRDDGEADSDDAE